MEFGLFTYGYQFYPLEKAFKDAKEFGYDYIELWGGRPHAFAYDILNGEGEEVLKLIKQYGIKVKVFTPEHNAYPFNYMIGSRHQWEECMKYFETAFKAATMIGAEYTLISVGHGGHVNNRDRWDRLVESMQVLSKLAHDNGQKILLETLTPMESNTCTKLDDLLKLLHTVNNDSLLGMCDVVSPYIQGIDPVDYLRKLGPKMAHLHLVDCDGKTEDHYVPGEGIMPLKEIVGGFIKNGYNGTATIELVAKYMDDPSYYAKLSLDRAKELL